MWCTQSSRTEKIDRITVEVSKSSGKLSFSQFPRVFSVSILDFQSLDTQESKLLLDNPQTLWSIVRATNANSLLNTV